MVNKKQNVFVNQSFLKTIDNKFILKESEFPPLLAFQYV